MSAAASPVADDRLEAKRVAFWQSAIEVDEFVINRITLDSLPIDEDVNAG